MKIEFIVVLIDDFKFIAAAWLNCWMAFHNTPAEPLKFPELGLPSGVYHSKKPLLAITRSSMGEMAS